MINKKISRGFLKVQIVSKASHTEIYKSSQKLDLASTLEGTVLCPFCSTTITAIQTNSLWDVSNFKCHLEVTHLHQKERIANENIDRPVHRSGLVEVTSKNLQKEKNSCGENFSASNNKALKSKSSNQKELVTDELHSSNGSSDIHFEGKEHQSFSEVLKESVRTLKFEKKIEKGALNLNCSSTNHLNEGSENLPNELLGMVKLKLIFRSNVTHKIEFGV